MANERKLIFNAEVRVELEGDGKFMLNAKSPIRIKGLIKRGLVTVKDVHVRGKGKPLIVLEAKQSGNDGGTDRPSGNDNKA